MGPSAETEFRGVFTQRQVNMFLFLAELANGRRDLFETPLKRDLDLFLGVGGSGRSPLNPPTPRYEGAGVRANQENKRKLVPSSPNKRVLVVGAEPAVGGCLPAC